MGTAMVRPFSAVHVVRNIAYGLKIARATIRAAFDTAIRRQSRSEGFGEVSLQPFFCDPTIEMIPRQHFIKNAPTQVEIGIDAVFSKRLLPEI
jgi:hypothetical protein